MSRYHGAATAAYHEAGHAVAYWKHGFRLKRATIVSDSDAAGSVSPITRLQFRTLEFSNPSGARLGRDHEQIVCTLAGRAAQRRYKPQSVRSYQAASDLKSVMDVLTRLHAANELHFVFRYLDTRARNFVAHPQHWRMIVALAAALLVKRTMSGAEIDETLRGSLTAQFAEMKGAA